MNKKGFIDLDLGDFNWNGFAILLVLALVGLFIGFSAAGKMGGGYSLPMKAMITAGVVVIVFIISAKMFD